MKPLIGLNKLTTLIFNHHHPDLSELKHLTQLETLSIYVDQISELEVLAFFPKLKHLYVDGCYRFWMHPQGFDFSNKYPTYLFSLESLDLKCNNHFSQIKMPNLKSLKCKDTKWHTEADYPELEELTLEGFNNLADIGHKYTKLTKLSINGYHYHDFSISNYYRLRPGKKAFENLEYLQLININANRQIKVDICLHNLKTIISDISKTSIEWHDSLETLICYQKVTIYLHRKIDNLKILELPYYFFKKIRKAFSQVTDLRLHCSKVLKLNNVVSCRNLHSS